MPVSTHIAKFKVHRYQVKDFTKFNAYQCYMAWGGGLAGVEDYHMQTKFEVKLRIVLPPPPDCAREGPA